MSTIMDWSLQPGFDGEESVVLTFFNNLNGDDVNLVISPGGKVERLIWNDAANDFDRVPVDDLYSVLKTALDDYLAEDDEDGEDN